MLVDTLYSLRGWKEENINTLLWVWPDTVVFICWGCEVECNNTFSEKEIKDNLSSWAQMVGLELWSASSENLTFHVFFDRRTGMNGWQFMGIYERELQNRWHVLYTTVYYVVVVNSVLFHNALFNSKHCLQALYRPGLTSPAAELMWGLRRDRVICRPLGGCHRDTPQTKWWVQRQTVDPTHTRRANTNKLHNIRLSLS